MPDELADPGPWRPAEVQERDAPVPARRPERRVRLEVVLPDPAIGPYVRGATIASSPAPSCPWPELAAIQGRYAAATSDAERRQIAVEFERAVRDVVAPKEDAAAIRAELDTIINAPPERYDPQRFSRTERYTTRSSRQPVRPDPSSTQQRTHQAGDPPWAGGPPGHPPKHDRLAAPPPVPSSPLSHIWLAPVEPWAEMNALWAGGRSAQAAAGEAESRRVVFGAECAGDLLAGGHEPLASQRGVVAFQYVLLLAEADERGRSNSCLAAELDGAA